MALALAGYCLRLTAGQVGCHVITTHRHTDRHRDRYRDTDRDTQRQRHTDTDTGAGGLLSTADCRSGGLSCNNCTHRHTDTHRDRYIDTDTHRG